MILRKIYDSGWDHVAKVSAPLHDCVMVECGFALHARPDGASNGYSAQGVTEPHSFVVAYQCPRR